MSIRFACLTGRILVALGLVVTVVGVNRAEAAAHPVGLGTATSFAVLAGSRVTNTGPSVISGNLGVSPGTAVTGFPPGTVNGTIHAANAVARQAQADVTTAYNDAAGRAPTGAVPADLSGLTLVPGVYDGGALELTGTLTLDGGGNSDAVFIFRAASTLMTASASSVVLRNGAQACNVFWQVTSSATLGTNSVFVGTILALTAVTANTGATVTGRLFARNAAVTLDNNRVVRPQCATPPPPPTTTTAGPTTSTTGGSTTTSTTGGSTTTSTTGGNSTTSSTTNPGTDGPGSSTSTTAGPGVGGPGVGGPGVGGPGVGGPGVGGPGVGGPGGGGGGDGTPNLARTGAPSSTTVAIGVSTLAMGSLLVLAARPSPVRRHAIGHARARR